LAWRAPKLPVMPWMRTLVSGVTRIDRGKRVEGVSWDSWREQAAAFKIILGDANVKGILVNIFGGIMDCNVIATGIIEAVKETGLKLPLVVRLEGNNVEAGKATLAASGLTIVSGDSMADAAQKIVKLVNNK
jgi:succinyl-CoA synthetase beta subunit